jgi:hypothetical protein
MRSLAPQHHQAEASVSVPSEEVAGFGISNELLMKKIASFFEK